MVKVQQGAVEAQMQRNQVEAAKIASNERIRIAELEQKSQEMQAKTEIQQLSTDLGILKAERDESSASAKTAEGAEDAEADGGILLGAGPLRSGSERAHEGV